MQPNIVINKLITPRVWKSPLLVTAYTPLIPPPDFKRNVLVFFFDLK